MLLLVGSRELVGELARGARGELKLEFFFWVVLHFGLQPVLCPLIVVIVFRSTPGAERRGSPAVDLSQSCNL
jgi:hypothetical protein